MVTNLGREPQPLYEEDYCARGEAENRIKEQQLDLFSDRTSCHDWWPNQFRLLLSSFAYVLVETLRRVGLADTELARAQAGTIRLKLREDRGGGGAQHPAGAAVVELGIPFPGALSPLRGLLRRLKAGVLAPAPAKEWWPCPRCAHQPLKGRVLPAFKLPASSAPTTSYPAVTSYPVVQRSG